METVEPEKKEEPQKEEPSKEEPQKEEQPKEEQPKEEVKIEEPPKEEPKLEEGLNTEEKDRLGTENPHLDEEEEEDEYGDMRGPKKPNFEYPEDYKEKEIKDVDLPNKLSHIKDIIAIF